MREIAFGGTPQDPMSAVFGAAMREWRRSVSKGLATSATARAALRQRIEQVMSVTIQREMEAIEKRLGFLATVGANATFVGLFGTVWGIMSSFRSIAASKNTSLAVVAPGIAEALFATAIGLFAAIPALIFYNILQGKVARARARMESFADEFSSIMSRQIDQRVATSEREHERVCVEAGSGGHGEPTLGRVARDAGHT